MNRTLIYMLSLIGVFLMCGVIGFVAAAPRSKPVLQVTAPSEENNVVTPGMTPDAAIPVTGEA